MIPLRSMDLSPIYRNRIFRSNAAVESHDMIAREFSDHSLKWRPGRIDASMHCVSTPQISLTLLTYGQDVEVRARPFDDFALVQMPIRGRAVIESDGHEMSVGPGEAAVIAPRHDLRLSWNKDCEQLIIRVPQSLARKAAAGIRSEYRHLDVDDEIAPSFFMDQVTCTNWKGVVQTLLNSMSWHADGRLGALEASWIQHTEASMALFLMMHASRRIGASSPTPRKASTAGGHRVAIRRPEALRAAERFVHSRLWAPIALEDMAAAAGLSPRSFHSCCKKHTGQGPVAWLREIRLEEAHRRLQQDSHLSVTDIALSVGFNHLGRFASYYRKRFGELPNETHLARVDNG